MMHGQQNIKAYESLRGCLGAVMFSRDMKLGCIKVGQQQLLQLHAGSLA
jgi:hypothetical protein